MYSTTMHLPTDARDTTANPDHVGGLISHSDVFIFDLRNGRSCRAIHAGIMCISRGRNACANGNMVGRRRPAPRAARLMRRSYLGSQGNLSRMLASMRAIRAPIWVTITRAARGWQPDRFAWYESAFFLILRHVRARFSEFRYGIENQFTCPNKFFRIIRRLRPARTVSIALPKLGELPRT